MVAETAHGGRKPFPEIRIKLTGRRRAHLILGPGAQIAAISGLFCGALALGYFGLGLISEPRQVARQEQAAVRTEIANADLQDALARLQDRLARTAGDRTAAETRLSAITRKAGDLRGRLAAAEAKLQASRDPPAPQPAAAAQSAATPQQLAQLRQALARVRLDVQALKAENATLAVRLHAAETDSTDQSALYRRYRIGLVQAQRAARRLGSRQAGAPGSEVSRTRPR
jgi:chromosome segregation ATPase